MPKLHLTLHNNPLPPLTTDNSSFARGQSPTSFNPAENATRLVFQSDFRESTRNLSSGSSARKSCEICPWTKSVSLVRLHSNYDPSSSRIFAADGGVARVERVGRGLEGGRDNARISCNRVETVANSGLRGIGVVDKRNLGRLHYRGDGETARDEKGGEAGSEKEGRWWWRAEVEVQFCSVNPGVGPGPCITLHRNSLFHVSLPVRVFCPPRQTFIPRRRQFSCERSSKTSEKFSPLALSLPFLFSLSSYAFPFFCPYLFRSFPVVVSPAHLCTSFPAYAMNWHVR